jgi:hypothetical protein
LLAATRRQASGKEEQQDKVAESALHAWVLRDALKRDKHPLTRLSALQCL